MFVYSCLMMSVTPCLANSIVTTLIVSAMPMIISIVFLFRENFICRSSQVRVGITLQAYYITVKVCLSIAHQDLNPPDGR